MRNEKEIMGAFIEKCKTINIRNNSEVEKIEKDLKEIFACEVNKMAGKYGEKARNIAPLKFMESYTIKDVDAVCGYERSNPPIINLGRKKLYENLNGSKQKREEAAKQILIHLLHEIYHHEQKMIMETQPYTREGAELIADSRARSARNIGYNFYQKNYWSMPIELSATENAINRYQEIMGKDERLNDRMELYRAHKEISMYNYGARLQEKEDVWYRLLNNKQTPEQVYETMQKNEKAIRKNQNLSQARQKELIIGIRELGYENLFRALKNSTSEQIAQFEKNCGKENVNKIYKKMYIYFEKEKVHKIRSAQTKKDMLNKIHTYNGIVAGEMDERKPEEASLLDIHRIKKCYDKKQKYLVELNKDIEETQELNEIIAIDENLSEKDKIVAYYAKRARNKKARKESKKSLKSKTKKSKKNNKKSKNAEIKKLKKIKTALENLSPEEIEKIKRDKKAMDAINDLRKDIGEKKPKNVAISDIHGMAGSYQKVVESLGKKDKLYILGDIIDRGPAGVEVLKDIMERTKNFEDNPEIITFLGNHEMMLLDAFNEARALSLSRQKFIDLADDIIELHNVNELMKKQKRNNNFANSIQDLEEQKNALVEKLKSKGVSRVDIGDLVSENSIIGNWLFTNGGYKTLKNFGEVCKTEEEIDEIFDFVEDTVLMKKIEANDQEILLVHAAPPKVNEVEKLAVGEEVKFKDKVTPQSGRISPRSRNTIYSIIWDRLKKNGSRLRESVAERQKELTDKGTKIVFGHDRQGEGKIRVDQKDKEGNPMCVCIDTAVAYGGDNAKLTVFDLDKFEVCKEIEPIAHMKTKETKNKEIR